MKCLSALLFVIAGFSTASQAAEEKDPQELFNSFCFSCHGTGWENAPVVGDSFDWEERKEQGIDTLLQHTLEGFNSMPPKGGCTECSEAELKSLVEWMTE